MDIAQGKVYANSPGLPLGTHNYTLKDETGKDVTGEVDEVKVLKEIFEKKGLVASPPGIFLGKKRYHLISFLDDENVAYLKSEEGGATVTKTNKLIIVGVWLKDKKQIGGDCNTAVEKLAEQFKKANY